MGKKDKLDNELGKRKKKFTDVKIKIFRRTIKVYEKMSKYSRELFMRIFLYNMLLGYQKEERDQELVGFIGLNYKD